MVKYPPGFFIFGGRLADGTNSNELWFYDLISQAWSLKATTSSLKPQPVTQHSLTLAQHYLYLIGGKIDSRITTDEIYRIDARELKSWERVNVRGGKYPGKRLEGHTTIYVPETHSLLVFGGYLHIGGLFNNRQQEVRVVI